MPGDDGAPAGRSGGLRAGLNAEGGQCRVACRRWSRLAVGGAEVVKHYVLHQRLKIFEFAPAQYFPGLCKMQFLKCAKILLRGCSPQTKRVPSYLFSSFVIWLAAAASQPKTYAKNASKKVRTPVLRLYGSGWAAVHEDARTTSCRCRMACKARTGDSDRLSNLVSQERRRVSFERPAPKSTAWTERTTVHLLPHQPKPIASWPFSASPPLSSSSFRSPCSPALAPTPHPCPSLPLACTSSRFRNPIRRRLRLR